MIVNHLLVQMGQFHGGWCVVLCLQHSVQRGGQGQSSRVWESKEHYYGHKLVLCCEQAIVWQSLTKMVPSQPFMTDASDLSATCDIHQHSCSWGTYFSTYRTRQTSMTTVSYQDVVQRLIVRPHCAVVVGPWVLSRSCLCLASCGWRVFAHPGW